MIIDTIGDDAISLPHNHYDDYAPSLSSGGGDGEIQVGSESPMPSTSYDYEGVQTELCPPANNAIATEERNHKCITIS